MATALKFELVSPERKLAEAEAESVTIPGQAGDLTAMANHAPFLTTMRPGFVTVRSGGTETAYVVTGGFVEISPDAVSVLAEEAVEKAGATRDWLDGQVKAAETALAEAADDRKQAEALRLNDFRALAEQIGG